MAKLTLLEIVQDILNDMDSDPVNSINDTVEALQIAQTVKTTYNNIVDGRDWPWQYELFQFDALSSTAKPNYLKIPDTIISLEFVKYNIRKSTDTKDKFVDILYKSPQDFFDLVTRRDSSLTTIQVVSDFSGVSLNILNNKAPQYYTSFDDQYIIFDSFDNTVDTTVMASKSSGHGKRGVAFTLSDTFTPDLPVQMFSYLLNESKATSFVNFKQMQNGKAEQNSVSQKRRMSQDAWRIKNGITYPNYGRK
jgi:hypothetical protein